MPRMSPKTAVRQWRAHLETDIDRMRGFPKLRRQFHEACGYMLNLEDPKTFSEKLQWRKVYDRNPLFPVLLDKVRMPEWARSVLPASDHRYLPEFLQIADDASQIDFAAFCRSGAEM